MKRERNKERERERERERRREREYVNIKFIIVSSSNDTNLVNGYKTS